MFLVLKPYVVFYGTQIYDRCDSTKEFKLSVVGPEVYNGGYVYSPESRKWYRLDLTPVLIEDVPKILRMLILVLNL